MTNLPVGIKAIAVSFPSVIRTNDYFREKYPQLVATAEKNSLAKAFISAESSNPTDTWTQEINPHLLDPFKGAVERRILGRGESSVSMEYDAVCKVLKASNMSLDDIDLILVSSMFPAHTEEGDAAYLAKKLKYNGPAWNVNSMCASAMISLHTAWSFIQSGAYDNILVVTSCTYSRFFDEQDTLSFFIGDGAAACVVSCLEQGQGILSTKIVNTHPACGAFFNQLSRSENGEPRLLIKTSADAGKLLPGLFKKYFRECCSGALEQAGVTIDEIDFFVSFNGTAWYGSFCTRELGIDPAKTIDIYPQYANISTAFTLVSLHHAAQLNKIRPNDLVLVYNHGFVASSVAMVIRWGDVVLAPDPHPSANLIRTPVSTLVGTK